MSTFQLILQLKDVAMASNEQEQVRGNLTAPNEAEQPELSSALRDLKHTIRSRLEAIAQADPAQKAQILSYVFAIAFGAIQCLAWNSPFPNSDERLAWRVCSVSSIAIPVLTALIVFKDNEFEPCLEKVFHIWVPLYVMPRVVAIMLAFMSLRGLPANVYETVNWTNYIPHFLV